MERATPNICRNWSDADPKGQSNTNQTNREIEMKHACLAENLGALDVEMAFAEMREMDEVFSINVSGDRLPREHMEFD